MRHNVIDVVKFVLSLFVVTIHCYIVNMVCDPVIKGVLEVIQSLAVPLFFCFTSYFLFSKMKGLYVGDRTGMDWHMTLKTCKRLGVMYVIWFFVFNFLVNPVYEVEPLLCKFLCWGSAHLWYLWSCLLCIPIIFFLLNRGLKPWMVAVLGVLLYVFFRVYSHFGDVENPIGISVAFAYMWKNHVFNVFGLCNGFCFLAMGMFVALTKPIKDLRKMAVIFVIGVLLSIPDKNRSVGIGMVPIVYVLFCAILNLSKKQIIGGGTSLVLRQMSIVIYLMHPIIINVVSLWRPASNVYAWLVILAGNVALGYVFVRLKRVRGFGWLNRLV